MAKPRLPFEGVRVLEKANLLSGRLTGLLFADQGAEVLVIDPKEGGSVDSYLNRNKIAVRASDVEPSSADIILESRKIKYFPQRSEGEHLAWLELQPVVIRDLPPAGAFCIPITEAVIPVHR